MDRATPGAERFARLPGANCSHCFRSPCKNCGGGRAECQELRDIVSSATFERSFHDADRQDRRQARVLGRDGYDGLGPSAIRPAGGPARDRSRHARLDGRLAAAGRQDDSRATTAAPIASRSGAGASRTGASSCRRSRFRAARPASTQLPRAERADLDAVTFVPIGGGAPMTWADSLIANYTDGIVVLHRGRIVYERYFGALTSDAAAHRVLGDEVVLRHDRRRCLIAEGKLDADATSRSLHSRARGQRFRRRDGRAGPRHDDGARLRRELRRRFAEHASVPRARRAWAARRRSGPSSIYAFLPTIKKSGTHGEAFHYRTPNTDVVGWLIARATGKSPAEAPERAHLEPHRRRGGRVPRRSIRPARRSSAAA